MFHLFKNLNIEKKWKILLCVALGTIMVPINATIVNVSLPTITEYFHVTVPTAQWIITSYLITLLCLVLFFGRLGEHYGKKRIYMAGLVSFLFSSFLCYLSPSVLLLIIFRALQGLAAAMMISVSLGIIKDSFPVTERGKSLGIYAVAIAAGLAMGPAIGGVMDTLFGWKYIFLFNLPIGIVSFLMCYHVLENGKTSKLRLNVTSAVFQFLTLFFLVYFLSEIEVYGIREKDLLLAFFSLLFLILFVYWELKSENPFFNLVMFKNSRFTAFNLALLFNYAAVYMIFFAIPFYLQKVMHLNAYSTGLILTVTPLMMMFIAPISGRLSDKLGPQKPAFAGSVLCLIAFILMTQLNTGSSQGKVVIMLAILGAGTAFFQSPNNSAIMNCFSGNVSIISSIIVTMRNLGMIMGVSMAAFILHSTISPQTLKNAELFSIAAYNFDLGLDRLMILGIILSILMAILSLAGFGLKRKISRKIRKEFDEFQYIFK